MKSPGTSGRGGFSLTEIVVTVAVLGVLTSIAVTSFSNSSDVAKRTVVVDHVELLNRALAAYSQNCWKMPTAAAAGDTTDEFKVLRSLQWTFPPSQLKIGSPYFDPKYSPSASSNTNDFRIRWNGVTFEVLDPGQSGTGLKFGGGNDFAKTPYSFPSDYKPEGA